MTEARKRDRTKIVFTMWVLLLFLCLYNQDAIIKGARHGIRLCLENVVPALFPFMVFSDLLSANAPQSEGLFSAAFCRFFRTSPKGAHAFLMGALGSFPLGAKVVCNAYEKGELTKEEAEHLLGFVNVTGPAFLVAGVGAALRNSVTDGLVFYGIEIIAAILVGKLTAPKKRRIACSVQMETEPFSLSKSLSASTLGMLSICGTVIFFSALSSLLFVVLPDIICSFLMPFLEITSGLTTIAEAFGASETLSFSLSCAAVGFGGICVAMQSALFAKKANLTMKGYYKGKILCALFSFLLGVLWCTLMHP